jgi:hypothetical protein
VSRPQNLVIVTHVYDFRLLKFSNLFRLPGQHTLNCLALKSMLQCQDMCFVPTSNMCNMSRPLCVLVCILVWSKSGVLIRSDSRCFSFFPTLVSLFVPSFGVLFCSNVSCSPLFRLQRSVFVVFSFTPTFGFMSYQLCCVLREQILEFLIIVTHLLICRLLFWFAVQN